jgi:hypothetical protein
MSKAQVEALTKRADAQDARIAKLEEINADLTEKIGALKVEPKKNTATKTKTTKVKVSAGAGSSEEEKPKKKKVDEMTDVQKLEHKIALSEKYIADESKNDEESQKKRAKRAKQLETERAQLRKLNSETADDEKDPVELPLKELQDLTLKLKLEPSTTAGVYTDSDGRIITGPPADSDEEFSEIDFGGETYDVGDNTMRVYRQYHGAAANPDKEQFFVGYPGVGNLHKMKIAVDE